MSDSPPPPPDSSQPPPSSSSTEAPSPPAGPPMPSWESLPHDSLQTNIIVAASVCWSIAAVFVALRFYTRGVIIRVVGWSDWSVLLALSAWFGVLFYALSLCFTKLAILMLYIHLFTFRWAQLAGQVLFGFVVVSHLYMAVTTFTACIPLQSYWDFRVPKRYCHSNAVWWSNTALHMVTDFLIFLLPMPVVWTINLPRRQKLILSFLFGFGFLVCFISILRVPQLLRAQTDFDFTYVAAELSYMTAVEVNGAIVCACVMTLKPFLAHFFPRSIWASSTAGTGNTTTTTTTGGGTNTGGSSWYSQSSSAKKRQRRTLRRHDRGNGPGGPPTIGSLPSKPRYHTGKGGDLSLASAQDYRDAWLETSGGGTGDIITGGKNASSRAAAAAAAAAVGRGPGRRVWVDGRGYVEIHDGDGDIWGVDVELAEHVGRGEQKGREGVGHRTPRSPTPPPVGSGTVRVDTEFIVEVRKAEARLR
ncbi:hypothetical protein VTJ49DRAFT_4634 [Mycothermus thermophilus]|uniref:Rhodopsin domain-containing protein n=1 Tax=Humicola insolens TaxID=85995 RepID=A0ABR3V5W1_HUMIN